MLVPCSAGAGCPCSAAAHFCCCHTLWPVERAGIFVERGAACHGRDEAKLELSARLEPARQRHQEEEEEKERTIRITIIIISSIIIIIILWLQFTRRVQMHTRRVCVGPVGCIESQSALNLELPRCRRCSAAGTAPFETNSLGAGAAQHNHQHHHNRHTKQRVPQHCHLPIRQQSM